MAFVFSLSKAWAGIVEGEVVDAETGETLVGAMVTYADGKGMSTDMEGHFLFNLPDGHYHLTIRYFGYKTMEREVVSGREKQSLRIPLEPDNATLGVVSVIGEAHHNTEAALTREQQESHVTMTGVSEQQIKKTQDKNAGEVIRRIPGVSIIDEKFVMVRGLSQRYNNVWLNGAAVPSSEADQRAFSFDIIPSGQLDNLKVVKSSAPEYPADFSGGFILVNTKDVPSSGSWSVGMGGGYNTETHQRAMLRGVENGKPFGGISANWKTRSCKPVADLTLSADLTQRWRVLGHHTLGLTGCLNFSNAYQTLHDMENNMFGAYDVTHQRSNYLRQAIDQQYNNSLRLGAMLGLIWLPTPHYRIELKQILNRLAKDRYTYRRGFDAQSEYMEQAEYYYQSRLTYNLGLSGKHTLGESDKMNWNLGYAYANRDLPDRKRYTIYNENDDRMVLENLNDINRELSHLDENIMSGAADWEHRLAFRAWRPTLKVGGYGEYRSRQYQTRFFTYAWRNGQLPEAMRALDVPTQLLTEDHYADESLYLIEQVDWSNNYEANARLMSGYLSLHLPMLGDRIGAYGGVRFEHSRTELISHTRRQEPSPLSTFYTYNDLFPSLNFMAHTGKTHQLRLAYGKTTNRPEFRELSTSVYYDFDLASNVQGNHHLQPAYIDNVDLGWEWYPHAGEVVSVSLFYKHFSHPIEWTYTVAGGTDLIYSYLNAEGANNYGVEVDVRKQLDFLHLPQLSASLNASWIKSRVEFAEGSKEVDRPMQGQSPYLVNFGLFWNSNPANRHKGTCWRSNWSAALLYNTIGKRLIGVGRSVGSGATEVRVPDSYEMPRHQLDLNIGKGMGRFDIRLSVRDLLAQKIEFKQFEKTSMGEVEQITRSYRPGRTFLLSLSCKMRK